MLFKIIKKEIILFILLLGCVNAQPKLIGMKFNEKENGTFITISFDNIIIRDNITAWFKDSGWFYITIYDSQVDTTKKWPFQKTGNILGINTRQIGKTSQIDYKLKNKIEDFDFLILNEKQINLSLRYPISETLAQINNAILNDDTSNKNNPKNKKKWFESGKFSFLLISSAFTAKGVIRKNKKDVLSAIIITILISIFIN